MLTFHKVDHFCHVSGLWLQWRFQSVQWALELSFGVFTCVVWERGNLVLPWKSLGNRFHLVHLLRHSWKPGEKWTSPLRTPKIVVSSYSMWNENVGHTNNHASMMTAIKQCSVWDNTSSFLLSFHFLFFISFHYTFLFHFLALVLYFPSFPSPYQCHCPYPFPMKKFLSFFVCYTLTYPSVLPFNSFNFSSLIL